MDSYKPIDWSLPYSQEVLNSFDTFEERLDFMVKAINYRLWLHIDRLCKEKSRELDKRFVERYFNLLSPDEKIDMIGYGFNSLNRINAW